MVYFFKARVCQQHEYGDFSLDVNFKEYAIYMGRDKIENDPLIHKSHPNNIWFHVDKYSSAHLYLQLSQEEQLETFYDLQLDENLLQQIGQLTKASSIKGNKLNNITIIYTPVNNLISDGSMDTGTVTFVDQQKVKRLHISKKENSIVNKLNRTKTEITIEQFVRGQEEVLRNWKRQQKEQSRKSEQRAKEEAKSRQLQKEFKKDPYADIYTEENLRASSNEYRNENWVEEEFW